MFGAIISPALCRELYNGLFIFFVARQSRVALGVLFFLFFGGVCFCWLRRLGFKPSFLFPGGCVF